MEALQDESWFGGLLRKARLAAGMTQEDLAVRSGLSARAISDLERHRARRPYFRSVDLLADALGVSGPVRAALRDAAGRSREERSPRSRDEPGEVPAWPQCQLPPLLADFTGREDESALVRGIVRQPSERDTVPIAVISGPPGVGKSTLALRVAHSLRPSFPDGQLYLQLAGASRQPRDPAEVLGEVLRASGVAPAAIPEGIDHRAALYRSRLAGRRVLVVADDAGTARQIEPLLPGTPGCAIITTSRDTLADLEGARLLLLQPLRHVEAVEMLGRIVGAERLASEQHAAERIARSCGMLPLAVRIAGAKLVSRPEWSLERVASLIDDERRRLDELAVGDLAVRASMAPSYEGLDERARRGFRLLALLGPADVAEWVMAALLGEPDAAGVAGILVDKSLLTLTGTDAVGEPRYRLHDLLRDYAAERLAAEEPAAEQEAALRRVLAGFLELADLADRRLPRLGFFPPRDPQAARTVVGDELAARLTAGPMAWFGAERLTLLALAGSGCARGLHQSVTPLAACWSTFQFLQHRMDDASQLWGMIQGAATRSADAVTSSVAKFHLAWVEATRGRFTDALASLDEGIPLLEESRAAGTLAAALYWRAFCAEMLGAYNSQRGDAERLLSLARQLEDPALEVMALRLLGLALIRLGDHEIGIALARQSVALARGMRELALEYMALDVLAYSLSLDGQYELAELCCHEGIEVSRRLGLYVMGQAYFLGLLSDACYGRGHYLEAIDALSEALPVFEQHVDRRGQALCLFKLGRAHQALGERRLAGTYLQRSLPIFRGLGLVSYEEQAGRALRECRAAKGPGSRGTAPVAN